MAEAVNHPAHYNSGRIEVIDFIEDQELSFNAGNTVKYVSRAGKKDPSKHIEDLEKARWYLNREISRISPLKLPHKSDTTAAEQSLEKAFTRLLDEFSQVLLKKLMANERKYKFGNGWKDLDWKDELQKQLVEHVAKGDPRDVAILALFAWYHNWPTAPAPESQDEPLTPL